MESSFVDLRRLADWFASPSVGRTGISLERVVQRLGATCVPLLGRQLASADPRRREAARGALARLGDPASPARPRVIGELQRIAASEAGDEGKVCALGLLAELGERGAARFVDPSAIQRRSALALAAQLDTPADVAAAVELMLGQLAGDGVFQLISVIGDAAPGAAHLLATELAGRLDVEPEQRTRAGELALAFDPPAEPARRATRPTRVSILVDAAARLVVVASRKVPGERRWRRWAVRIDQQGRIDDCVHEDGAHDDDAPVVVALVADGYRAASTDLEHARAIVAAAARQSPELQPAYYLGRDLLDLGEAHLGGRTHAHPTSATLGRAVELIAEGEPARAQALLARCDRGEADAAAAAAACALIACQPGDAIAHLARAIEAEPEWPLHHWNLAAACHQLGDVRGVHAALCRFLATSTKPTGLFADPDQPGRVALASRLVEEMERTSRLAGAPLARPRQRQRRSRRRRGGS